MQTASAMLLLDHPLGGGARGRRLNRSEARYALNTPLRRAFATSSYRLDQDHGTRGVIVCGAPQSFSDDRRGSRPGTGTTQRLVRAMRKYPTMKLLLNGESIGPDAVFSIGLVSELVADDAFDVRASEWATENACRPPIALRLIKEVALCGAGVPLAIGLMLERRVFEPLFE